MSRLPRVLLTNDDGIEASGLYSLWESLADIAQVSIVAPEQEQSSTSLAITVRSPLHVRKKSWCNEQTEAWSVSGTPADCIKMALSTLLKERPHFVVSGINRGSNAGRNVLYSGTVAGAIESILQGIPSLAVSCVDYHSPDYHSTKEHLITLVRYFFQYPPPEGTLMNVNFPSKARGVRGLRLARQGKSFWKENPEKREHPEGAVYYWLGAKEVVFQEDEDSDIYLLDQGYATVVPIHVNELTDNKLFEERRESFKQFFY